MPTNDEATDTVKVFEREDVYALVQYLAHHPKDVTETDVANLTKAIREYDNAVKTDQEVIEKEHDVVKLYTKLNKVVYPLSGNTINQSLTHKKTKSRSLLTTTLTLLFLVSFSEIVKNSLLHMDIPERGMLHFLNFLQRDILELMSPMFWGALGSCVFLMKRRYDFIEAYEFDPSRYKSNWIRILLGGILAFIFVYVMDLKSFGEASTGLSAQAMAFFVGLSVRAVYNGMENLINTMANSFSKKNVRKGDE